jgi:hypothetical protein
LPRDDHDIANTKCGFVGVLVFPDPEANPSGVFQPLVGVAVTRYVAAHFIGPELRVCDGYGVVLGAPVPKAPIKKDRDFCLWEDKVGCAPQVF